MSSARVNPVTVILIDDDQLVHQAVRHLLDEPDIEVIATCKSARLGVETAQRAQPRIALVDLLMAGDPRAGIEVIRQIRQVSPPTICAVLTAFAENGEYLFESLRAGAQAYYSKGYATGDRLPELVRSLADEDYEIEPRFARQLAEFVADRARRDAEVLRTFSATPHAALTPRERTVLDLVAQGYQNRDIAHELCITAASAKAHRQNIAGKLGLDSTALLVVYAFLERYLVAPLSAPSPESPKG